MSIPTVPVPMENPRAPWYRRLPVVSHFNKSVGLQRGMMSTMKLVMATMMASSTTIPCTATKSRAVR